jgi:hypothetical protein
MEDRPYTITLFELLMLGSLFPCVIQLGLTWTEISELAAQIISPVLIMAFQVMGMAVTLVLTLLITRLQARFAVYIVSGLFLLASPGFIMAIMRADAGLVGTMTLLNTGMQMLAIPLLWTGSARDWVAQR